jgi:hypothetical protein
MPPLLAVAGAVGGALGSIGTVASVATAGVSLVGGLIGASGAEQQANAAAASAQTNANIQLYNASVADRNREATLQASDSDAQKQQRDNARQLGAIRVAYGASGLSMAGSPLEQLGDTAMRMQQDVDTTRYRGTLAAAGYTDEANVDRTTAQLDEQSAGFSKTAGGISATTAFLGGVAGAGSALIRNK